MFEKTAKMTPAILFYVCFLGFLVFGKKVLLFLGHNSDGYGGFRDVLCHVFERFLFSGKKVLLFLGHASVGFGGFRDVLCTFLRVSYFREKGFAIFGTCRKTDTAGGKMFYVPFWGFLIFRKNIFEVWRPFSICLGEGFMEVIHPRTRFHLLRHRLSQNLPMSCDTFQ